MMASLWKRWVSTSRGDTAGLALSTLSAQGVGALSLIVMGRNFSTAAVGHYQVFFSYVGLFLPVALLSYHVILPHLEEPRFLALLRGAWTVLGGWVLLVAVVFVGMGYPHAGALALLLGSSGAALLCDMVNLRFQRFRPIMLARVMAPVLFLGWLLGSLAMNEGRRDISHLLLGQTIASAGTSIFYVLRSFKGVPLHRAGWRDAWRVCREKKMNALVVAPSELLNALVYNLPTILLGSAFGPEWAAYYGTAMRFCFLPVQSVTGAVGQVFHGDLARAVLTRDASALIRYQTLRSRLWSLGVAVALGIAVSSPVLFRLLLGPSWAPAGWTACLLSPMFGAMVAVAPLGVCFFVFEKQIFLLAVQLAYTAIVGVAFGAGIGMRNPWVAIGLFSLLAALRYAYILAKADATCASGLSFPKAAAG